MEIGSEFSLNFIDLSIKKNNIFKYLSDYNAVYFNYARCAIGYLSDNLLDDNNYVFLPSYICESVVEAFKSKKIVFYQLNNDFSINIEDLKKKLELYKCSVIYLMNYWGQDNNKSIYQELTDLKIKYEFYLVEDTTHSIFTNVGVIADFYVCSLRKWMPIPDGAVLYYKNDLLKMRHLEKSSTSYKIYGMSLKKMYLDNNIEVFNQEYRNIFKASEDNIEFNCKCLISDLSRFIMMCIDIDELVKKRINNFRYLLDKFHDIGIDNYIKYCINKNINEFCPFTLPIMVKNRDKFREYLINNKIYCAVHWPISIEQQRIYKNVQYISQHIISLPIDQRYSAVHMDFIAEKISLYYGEL